MKTILSILFLFVCAFAHAQYHNVEGIRVVGRSDSTTISNVGQIQFDADDDKFRFNDGTGWYSFLKEGATLPYWPLSGSATLTGSVIIDTPTGRSMGLIGSSIGFGIDNEASELISESPFDGEEYAFMGGGDAFLLTRIENNGGIFYWDQGSPTFTKPGLRYIDYDSTEWTDSTLVTKAYVDGKVSSGAFWPLTGTADLTGNTVIDGNNFDLTIGSTNRLNTATIRADSDISLNSDAGTNQAFITVSPGGGLIRLSFSTDDGSSEESGILIQSAGDEIIITAGGSEAIVVESDGDIKMNVTRTDCTGADAGTVYSVAGVLNICP